jgi:hypothetical protein
MKTKRFIALALSLLMAGGTLVSCSTGDNSDDPKDTIGTGQETDEEMLKDNLPDNLNYGGETIVFIANDTITTEEAINGDPVNDIIYERNKFVEERLGVKIDSINEGNAIDKVVIAINGGSADYDVLVDCCWRIAPKFTDGYFRDLRDTQYLDFDQIWWNQSFNEAIFYNEAQYGITGDITLSLYRRTYATVFNKSLFTEAQQPYLYQFVEDGTWTLEKQTAMTPIFHRDNGDGKQDMTGDIYGFVSNDFISVDPYWAACEVDIIRKNQEGDYEWVFDVEKLNNVADKVLALYYGTDGASYIEQDNYVAENTAHTLFSGGRAAMATLTIVYLESGSMRDMPQEYGIVPIPKFDVYQKEYHSQMHDGFTIMSLPTTVKENRLDMVSAVMEAMGSSSYNLVRPVYYETTLRTKIAKDPQSSAMMDLIINSIHLDVGFVYSHSMSSFHQGLQDIVDSKINTTASRYKSMSKAAQKSLGVLIKKLDKLSS